MQDSFPYFYVVGTCGQTYA